MGKESNEKRTFKMFRPAGFAPHIIFSDPNAL